MLKLPVEITRKYRLRDYQFSLILFVVALTIIGIMVIGSAEEAYQKKQIAGLVLGIFAMVFISLVDYHYIVNFHWIWYGVAIFFLGWVLVAGDSTGGAARWIDMGFIRFQPSELAKILVILFLAKYLTLTQENLNKPKVLAKVLLVMAIPVAMILKQPDLSTSIVLFAVCMVLLYLAELSYKIILPALGVGIPAFAILFYLVTREEQTILSNYQWLRIMAWLHPDEYPQSAYQQQNSITAIGSGCLFGKGLYNTDVNSVKNGNFISEPQTDFIFAVTGEELGFLGCCLVIGLLLIISLECFYIGTKAKDLEGKLICFGVGSLISVQSFVNICVVTGLMPNTGLPLPFVSYGLTSLVTSFAGMGFVLNVGLQRQKY